MTDATPDEQTVERVAKAINGPHDATHIGAEKLRELQDYRWEHKTHKSEKASTLNAARAAIAAMPDPSPTPMHEDAPRAIIGEIGNQIHNLGCSNQGNEELSEALANLAARTWAAAQLVSSEPLSMPDTKALEAADRLISIVDGIGGLSHGTWRDEKGMRIKDTPEWVSFYVAARGGKA